MKDGNRNSHPSSSAGLFVKSHVLTICKNNHWLKLSSVEENGDTTFALKAEDMYPIMSFGCLVRETWVIEHY